MKDAVPPFLPTSISSLYFWLDPTDNATITQSSGTCSQINDKSGNGKNFAQATSGKRPSVTAAAINGQQAFTFATASNQGMDGTITTITGVSWTIAALIYSTTNTTFNGILVSFANGTDCTLCIGPSNSTEIYVQATHDTAIGSANSVNVNTAYWVMMTYDATGTGLITNYVNDVSKGSNTQGSTARTINTSCGWGNNAAWGQGFQGILGDVCVYNKLLNTTERGNLYTQFAKPKWGLP